MWRLLKIGSRECVKAIIPAYSFRCMNIHKAESATIYWNLISNNYYLWAHVTLRFVNKAPCDHRAQARGDQLCRSTYLTFNIKLVTSTSTLLAFRLFEALTFLKATSDHIAEAHSDRVSGARRLVSRYRLKCFTWSCAQLIDFSWEEACRKRQRGNGTLCLL